MHLRHNSFNASGACSPPWMQGLQTSGASGKPKSKRTHATTTCHRWCVCMCRRTCVLGGSEQACACMCVRESRGQCVYVRACVRVWVLWRPPVQAIRHSLRRSAALLMSGAQGAMIELLLQNSQHSTLFKQAVHVSNSCGNKCHAPACSFLPIICVRF